MTRKKKLFLNTIFSLADQITIVVCGFILPRLFLTHYGSAVNGLIASISQFLGVIALCECGIGPVIRGKHKFAYWLFEHRMFNLLAGLAVLRRWVKR